ncbi:hypothetical protein EN851_11330 [Mesorhizobium sp. M8A.F.Ca.ET.208.01.1.1]|uniref:hypothetical protein n=1 Tax=unclassified Mesorhizobium TaxID=325217 RepID=UPI0010937194|nr:MULTISPECIES: hypothetical protein [unclassified Mesorhizobium]TGQ92184.1 hypothetical protein EN851_11330 [Mesorhizobium sp. M8A.F.Ca.ET.208.01.1.1]TGT52084.1 hypothetical protein EN810_11320 [Mesorhizobium sp. M8A.F.Ca.ET.167.01.1.1]
MPVAVLPQPITIKGKPLRSIVLPQLSDRRIRAIDKLQDEIAGANAGRQIALGARMVAMMTGLNEDDLLALEMFEIETVATAVQRAYANAARGGRA